MSQTINYSPLLYPDVGEQHNAGAAVFYNNALYYIGNGHASGIWILQRTLDQLDPGEDPDNESSYWQQSVLDAQQNFTSPVQCSSATNRQTAAGVAGDNLYFVWIQDDATDNQPSNSVWATQAGPSAQPSQIQFSVPVQLCDTSGSPLAISTSNLAVMAWGTYLVGCFNSGSDIQFLVYDTDEWPTDGSSNWSAVTGWKNSFADWPNFPPQGELGDQISMDWFTTSGTPPAPDQPSVYYIVSFFNSSTGIATVLHMMNVASFDQWSEGQPFQTWKVEQWANVGAGVSVIRDPGGRMRAYYADASNGNVITVRVLATDTISSDGFMWNLFGPPAPLYGESNAAQMPPVPAFVLGPAETQSNQTTRQVYEFVLFPPYGHEHIYLVFSHFGKAVQLADQYQLPFIDLLPAQNQQKLIVTGLVDSPLPMPAVNVASRPGSYSAPTIGYVTYGTTAMTGENSSTSWSWSAGFMSSSKAQAGVGPAWNISFQAGMAGATGASSTTQLGTQSQAQTNVNEASKMMLPAGALFSAQVVYHRDEYTFFDLSLEGTTYTAAENAPQITAIWIEYIDPATEPVNPYANTVGNIWSYTRDGWNARMRQLGYPSDNYFDEVIALQDQQGNYVNAVMCGGSNDTPPYLPIAWSSSSSVTSQFLTVSNSFTESGWHLQASAYVGISFALGVSVFGIGEKQMGELLFGGSYSRTVQQTTAEGHTWGITVSYPLQFPMNTAGGYYPGGITALTWNLWLLKSNSQWTDELISYGNVTGVPIDPGSAPWRIIFEVVPDTIQFKGDNRNLVYCDDKGHVIEAWYDPVITFSYGLLGRAGDDQGIWGWTNITEVATAVDGSGGKPPIAAGAPFWFAWGLSQPGYRSYAQAVVFRSKDGHIHILLGTQWPVASTSPPPGDTLWQWCDLGETPNFILAAGDPVGFCWEESPEGPEVHVFYRGVDGNIYELWARDLNQQPWGYNNLTGSLPQEQKPTGDPCALVWNEDPAGASEHVFFKGYDNKIHELYYDTKTFQWGQTNLSEATGDGAIPEGDLQALVWNASLHVGYRGSSGEMHELRREDNEWQPADDPSWDAHATAPDQRAAEGASWGLAWQRRQAPQSIHWFYRTVSGVVAELYRFDGAPNAWGWNNLNQMASNPNGDGQLPDVAAILQGHVWNFDPTNGSSMQLYLCDQGGLIYELSFVPDGPTSQDGAWQWQELTGWVTDINGNLLPKAAVPG